MGSNNAGKTSNILSWIFFALAAIAVGLRFVRLRYGRDFLHLDDYIMVFSLVLNLGGVISNSIGIHYGLGEHLDILLATAPDQVPKAGMWAVIINAFGIFADSVPKLAVAILVNRVLAPKRPWRIWHIVLPSTLIVMATGNFLLNILQCNPVQHQWDPVNVPGTCVASKTVEDVGIASGSLSSFVDFYFTVYPPIIISQLNMSVKRKIIATITMSLGIFALFTTVYKTAVTLPKLGHAEADLTWILCEISLWGLLEASVVMMAGSVPTWGWLLRTASVERIVSWVTLHGSRFSLSSRGSGGSNKDLENDEDYELDVGTGQRHTYKENNNNRGQLDSVAELERSALRK